MKVWNHSYIMASTILTSLPKFLYKIKIVTLDYSVKLKRRFDLKDSLAIKNAR